jgi:signal transduction histidine kinase
MNTRTIASDQTGSLSEVASIIHDLRNPLAAIHGSAEMLVRSEFSQPQVHRIARTLYCASIRMRELLEQCLDRTRSAGKEVEFCDLGALIGGALDRIAVSAEFQSVRIELSVPEGLVLAVDRHRIHRVLVNLLVNALEVMPHGGTIYVSAVSAGLSVWIRVRDTGPGIAPEIKDRLFQPFATAGKPNGIGLGLALSRQTVTDHGGEMWAVSSRQGACFVLRLPRTIVPPLAALR